jgi:cyclophilin family peptidyl-prolyl cis-trans isomerase
MMNCSAAVRLSARQIVLQTTTTLPKQIATVSQQLPQNHNQQRRCLAVGSRGARGHGWFINYRRGKGGRHLQGEFFDRESLEICQAWNKSIFDLGSTQVYMDVVLEPKSTKLSTRTQILTKNKRPSLANFPDLDTLTGPKVRLVMDVASKVMPESTDNFIKLCTMEENGYKGTTLYRFEKKVGVCGGDVLSNTGKTGLAAPYDISVVPDGPLKGKFEPLARTIVSDPLALWHLPGTVTMVVKRVNDVDSRFVFCTERSMHMDGIHRAIGQLRPESLEILENWKTSLLTQNAGVPSSQDLVVVECGLLDEQNTQEAA